MSSICDAYFIPAVTTFTVVSEASEAIALIMSIALFLQVAPTKRH